MNGEIPGWFPIFFPIFFVGMWLLSTTLLGFMSGWFNLQQWYPEPSEEPLLKLRGQSGTMGFAASLNGVLTLTAYRSGLGVGIWRIFGPFQRPFVVPWSEIEANPTRTLFTPMAKLRFGNPSMGTLKISARSWLKLVSAAQAAAPLEPGRVKMPAAPDVTRGAVARGMFFEWLTLTTIMATFFIVMTRSWPADPQPPLLLIAFPGLALAIGQLIRFARQG